jgi:hypothetical protein
MSGNLTNRELTRQCQGRLLVGEDLSTVTGDVLGVLNVTDFQQKPAATCRNENERSDCKIGFVGPDKVDFEVLKQLLRRTAKSK